MPVARFEQRLGALRAVAKQRIVAIEAGQDQVRDIQRSGSRDRRRFDALDIAAVDHGWLVLLLVGMAVGHAVSA